jgi:7-cyano-7-deazaguanine synthase in queuosine biosynthesis
MGKDFLTLEDGIVFDFDYHFPKHLKTVALSMSGGVESTLLCYLLVERYGAENVYVFSGKHDGRRWWEAANSQEISNMLGVTKFYSIPLTLDFMSPQENWKIYARTKLQYKYDGWFNGTNAKLFTPSNVTSSHVVDELYKQNHFLPLVYLKKYHTVGMYYKLGIEDLLYRSYSCSVQSEKHCGKCVCCLERVRGFATLGKRDQSTYSIEWDKIVDQCYHSDRYLVNQ